MFLGGVFMNIESSEKSKEMLALKEALIAVEEERLAGKSDVSLDELDYFLDEVIGE